MIQKYVKQTRLLLQAFSTPVYNHKQNHNNDFYESLQNKEKN